MKHKSKRRSRKNAFATEVAIGNALTNYIRLLFAEKWIHEIATLRKLEFLSQASVFKFHLIFDTLNLNSYSILAKIRFIGI